jgi:hypothetical protein
MPVKLHGRWRPSLVSNIERTIVMVTTYSGFKLFALPRDGGHFVRLRTQNWPYRNREAPFTETDVFASEGRAIQEAKRLVDDVIQVRQVEPVT